MRVSRSTYAGPLVLRVDPPSRSKSLRSKAAISSRVGMRPSRSIAAMRKCR